MMYLLAGAIVVVFVLVLAGAATIAVRPRPMQVTVRHPGDPEYDSDIQLGGSTDDRIEVEEFEDRVGRALAGEPTTARQMLAADLLATDEVADTRHRRKRTTPSPRPAPRPILPMTQAEGEAWLAARTAKGIACPPEGVAGVLRAAQDIRALPDCLSEDISDRFR